MIRSAILYHVYSGHLFFTAAALFLLGALIPRARVLMLLAIPLAALSGTPMPLWFAVLLLVLAIAALAESGRLARSSRAPALSEAEGSRPAANSHRARRPATAAGTAALLVAVAFELPYHVQKPIVPHPTRLFVIGDSLASGGFGESAPWPSHIGATNLARPADNAATARDQLALLPAFASGDTVIVEIGGNDMLEGRPLAEFREGFRDILAKAKPRRIIVIELPLLPGAWRYGAAQRSLARKHDAVLVPKRIMASVLTDSRNTVDGLHLNDRGHDAMARAVVEWLRWVRR